MSGTASLLSALPWFAWVAIIGLVGVCITDVAKNRYRHLERMEKLRQGIDPDARKPSSPPEV